MLYIRTCMYHGTCIMLRSHSQFTAVGRFCFAHSYVLSTDSLLLFMSSLHSRASDLLPPGQCGHPGQLSGHPQEAVHSQARGNSLHLPWSVQGGGGLYAMKQVVTLIFIHDDCVHHQ